MSSDPNTRWYLQWINYVALGLVLAPPVVLFLSTEMSGLFISVLWLACWILGGALLAGEEYLRQKEIRVAGFFETLRKAATAKRTAIIVSIFLLIYVEIQIRSLQSDFAAYVAPRTVSQQQSDALVFYLKERDNFPVFVKFDPGDQEAQQFANQIYSTLRKANWLANIRTDAQNAPQPGVGLCIFVMGENGKPSADPKHDPAAVLQQGFQAAGISINCGGGQAAGEYSVFITVGRRPLVVGYAPPLANRIARWIADHFGGGGPF